MGSLNLFFFHCPVCGKDLNLGKSVVEIFGIDLLHQILQRFCGKCLLPMVYSVDSDLSEHHFCKKCSKADTQECLFCYIMKNKPGNLLGGKEELALEIGKSEKEEKKSDKDPTGREFYQDDDAVETKSFLISGVSLLVFGLVFILIL